MPIQVARPSRLLASASRDRELFPSMRTPAEATHESESPFRRDGETSTRDACAPQEIAIALRDLVQYIDWSPFFHAWEIAWSLSRDLR